MSDCSRGCQSKLTWSLVLYLVFAVPIFFAFDTYLTTQPYLKSNFNTGNIVYNVSTNNSQTALMRSRWLHTELALPYYDNTTKVLYMDNESSLSAYPLVVGKSEKWSVFLLKN